MMDFCRLFSGQPIAGMLHQFKLNADTGKIPKVVWRLTCKLLHSPNYRRNPGLAGCVKVRFSDDH
jgi:hypothetical protein